MTLTRADGTVTASGYAVAGADKYHITYTSDGGKSWGAAAVPNDNYAAATITFTADNAKSYVVGVRAGNDHGWSGWRNSPSAGPYTPDQTPTPPPPAAPSSVTLTRADGTVTASGYAVSGADKYHITYTSDGGKSWGAAAVPNDNFAGSSITFNADNAKSYIVGVRAGNSTGWSGWVNSPSIGPYTPPAPAAPAGLRAIGDDQSVILSWDDPENSSITGYEYRTRRAGVAWGAWTAIANSGADTTSHTVTGLDNGTEYRFKLRAVNAGGKSGAAPTASPWYVAATPEQMASGQQQQGVSLAASDVTYTTATLTLIGHTGNWWYQANVGPHAACSTNPVTGMEVSIDGLTSGTTYTYTAYSNSACSAVLASHTFTTLAEPTLTATGVGATTATLAISNWTQPWWHKEVYPGYGNCLSGGAVSGLEPGQQYRFKAYSDRYCDTELVASPTELTTAAVSLSADNVNGTGARLNLGGWSATDPNWHYRADQGPDASSCSSGVSGDSANLTGLSANTTYTYDVYSDSSCHYSKRIGGVKFTTVVRLDATVHIWRSGTLAISGWTGDWWHDNGQGSGCTKVDAPATQKSVSFHFSGSTAYHYKAYGAAGCNSADQIAASAHFRTPPKPSLTVNHIGVNTATVTLNDWNRQWWYRTSSGALSPCLGPVAAGTNTVTYSSTGGYPNFVAYETGACAGGQSLVTKIVPIPNKVVGNIDEASWTGFSGIVGRAGKFGVVKRANEFTTGGSGRVQNVTIKLRGKAGNPGGIVVAIHNADANGKPGSHKVTFGNTSIAGSNPTKPGEYIYECTNTHACSLSANTSYFLVVSASGVPSSGYHSYAWQYTSADTESGGGGWTIGDVSHIQTDGGAWQADAQGRSLRFKVHAQ